MSKKLVSLFVFVLVFVLVFGLFFVLAVATYRPTEHTIKAPGYATNGSAMHAVSDKLGFWVDLLPAYVDADATPEEGPLGLFVSAYRVRTTSGRYGFENFGQTCGLASLDEITFDSKTKTATAIFRASTDDQDFLTWCQSQVGKTTPVYVVSAEKVDKGFLIKYHKEDWQTKVIFRIDD